MTRIRNRGKQAEEGDKRDGAFKQKFFENKVKARCGEVSTSLNQDINRNLKANIQAEKYQLQTSLKYSSNPGNV